MDISDEIEGLVARNELLQDPTRFEIYTQTFLRPGITATELLEVVEINRSTLSFHLTKMVDAGILTVSVPDTGRQVKSYALKHQVHKLDIHPQSQSSKFSRKERERLLRYRINQMGFEFRLASMLIDQLPHPSHGTVENIEVSSSHLSYETDADTYQLLNGGLFFDSKEQVLSFMGELEQLVEQYKLKDFQLQSGMKKSYALLLGAYPLPQELVVHSRVEERQDKRDQD
jgi:DNA-binding transcriptional ArsR family regulator